ncbi:alpha-L-glutamate ligase [Acrasis kona]|uniref:N-acetylaspartylglutamate synthase n=1 Tax=Acrasis kona TaxID=1008807 RepID=A0AAW2ZJD9_9EUKA
MTRVTFAFCLVLLLITIATVICQQEDVNNPTEFETDNTDDAVLNSNGTDVLTTQAVFFGDHTQTQKNNVQLRVRKGDYEKYQFQPIVIGGNASDSETMWSKSIRFMNAQNNTYYERQLRNPVLTLWILISRNPKEKFEYSYSLKRFIETAWKLNIQATVVSTYDIDLLAADTGLQKIVYKHQPVEKMPDAILPRMGAKIDYHSLAVVRQFDKMDVLVLNNHNSLEISRDKLHSIQQLATYNLPIPKTMMAKFPVDTENIAREFDFPVVLKKVSGSQGKGVMLVNDRDHLKSLQEMIDVTQPMIFQQYISNSRGRDIRVIVVGGKVIGAMMRQAGDNGFKSNFHQGGFVESVQISRAVEWLAIEAVRLIDLDVAGVDILIDTNSYRICEINASPGFQGFEMATGVDVPQHIMDFIKLRSGVWGKKVKTESKKKNGGAAVYIPVSAEHVLPKPLKTKQISVEPNGSQQVVH